MKVVHLSTADSGGGAFRAAFRLHSGLRRLGVDSEMIVLRRGSGDDKVFAYRPWPGLLAQWRRKLIARTIWREYEKHRPTVPAGVEPFSDDRSTCRDLLQQLPKCDVLNFHWIGGLLDWNSFFTFYPAEIPVVWRLADMGAFTGGCHYDQGCGKFTAACGACPQLGSSDAGDLSRQVWQRKRSALEELSPAGLHIVGPSRWIADQARRSSLFGGFPTSVIPNGLDVEEFAPRDKGYSRDLWNIPRDARVVLFAAESVANVRKGFKHLADALAQIGNIDKLLLVSVGGGKCELPADLRHLPLGKVNSDRMLSTIYSAADVFVIPSLQESFGQTVIESLACGTPVVGFASGGIVDMVRPGQTGWLAETGSAAQLRDAIAQALSDDAARTTMSAHCRKVALDEYSVETQASAYLKLYETLISHPVGPALVPGSSTLPRTNAPPQAAG